jgi:SAM-dependent methyltransferase
VSVVIPCFNLGAYLDECVQSVLDQTFQDFEIIIVDDGSDDPATCHMLTSYKRPKTRLIRTKNQGLAAARNLGFGESSGRYVSFLDADDLFEPRFLEQTVAVLDTDSAAFASCWLKAFGAAEFEWTPSRCDFPHLLAEDTVCTAALTRRESLLDVGGFDRAMPVAGYEDWELAISLVEGGHAGSIIPEVLFKYRIRPGAMTGTCTAPDNHARLMEYIIDKHADTYRRDQEGVLSVIDGRVADLERQLEEVPPRPDRTGRSWRDAILDLENHRRALQELLHPPLTPQSEANLEWGSFRRLSPISRVWGLDRGRPIDRYFIEGFLQQHAADIAGNVLEVKDPNYTRTFGTGVTGVEVVDIAPDNPDATLVADLAVPGSLPEDRFDCFILTQTVHIVYEAEEVVRNAFRTLRPGGVVLATLPCLSRIDYESGLEGDYWRFTPASARRLFEGIFGHGNAEVEAWGNVLACTAFLQGLAVEDLDPEELDHRDPYFPLLVTIRAAKQAQIEATSGVGAGAAHPTRHEAQIQVLDVTNQPWARPLAGCHVDLPTVGAALPYPTLDIAGWVLSTKGPVEAIELVHEATVIRRVAPDGSRPDLAAAFPDIPGADRAGYRLRVSLLGLATDVDLDLQAVLVGEERCPIGRIRLAVPAPHGLGAQLVVVFETSDEDRADPLGVMSGAVPIRAAFSLNRTRSGETTVDPGIHRLDVESVGSWDLGSELPRDVAVWLTDGGAGVEIRDVLPLVSHLSDGVDFAVLAGTTAGHPPAHPDLLSVLSGTGLGIAVIVKYSALSGEGGFDASAPSPEAAVWDLCVRLTLVGRTGVVAGAAASPEIPSLAERAGPGGARWLVGKHARAYAGRMADVLASRERLVGDVLRANHALEGRIEALLRPAEQGLRRERDRLAAKLRRRTKVRGRTGLEWGDLRRSRPFSDLSGSERGLPIDLYYIEQFLGRHRSDVRGTVLEVQGDVYTNRYGGRKVERSIILDVDPGNPTGTLMVGLGSAGTSEAGSCDCVILTQALQLVEEPQDALSEVARILKPAGVLLASVPSVSRVDIQAGPDRDYWRFTEHGLRDLLQSAFRQDSVQVEAHGNRAAAVAFLVGLAADEVDWIDLDAADPACPVVLTAVARAPAADQRA